MLINSRCPCAGFCVVFDFDFVKKGAVRTLNWIKQYLEQSQKWAYNWNLFSDDNSTVTKWRADRRTDSSTLSINDTDYFMDTHLILFIHYIL